MQLKTIVLGLLAAIPSGLAQNSSYLNPVLPGWHSDPSCTRVNDTFFCATSTFLAFPGLPVYASRDLINWRLISHAWNRESQLPGVSWGTVGQMDGMYAPTLRYHDGEFFLICEYIGAPSGLLGVVFRATNPFDDASWSDPVPFYPTAIDPDLFWDDDGKVYTATQGVILQELNLETGELSQPPISLWNGTGGIWPEGPHLYKKDGWYYLLIAEGGTGPGHSVTIARASSIQGPYEAYEGNPILTNAGTSEYFQTVGHADLFTDTNGNWWGLCLATRSGPEFQHFPMGREAVLFSVAWEEGEWPVLDPVQGRMTGWPLPQKTRDIPGDGPFNSDPDRYHFTAQSPIPKHFVYWRVPREGAFTTTNNGLQIVPSRSNLTGVPSDLDLSGQRGISFIGRRQTHTLFEFTVDLSFAPTEVNQEAGITVLLTQFNHIDLGLVMTSPDNAATPSLHLRVSAVGTGASNATQMVPVPEGWTNKPIRLHIKAEDPQSYILSASSGSEVVQVGTASSSLVSGDSGPFVGSLLGAYATCNGAGNGDDCPEGGVASFQQWQYTPVAQFIAVDVSVPA
ncbi:xylosidase : arabinofuranosidase [Aspergillus nidulans var. acristatus]